MKILIKAAIVVPIDQVDIPDILEHFRQEGAAEIYSIEIIDVDEDKLNQALQNALKEFR